MSGRRVSFTAAGFMRNRRRPLVRHVRSRWDPSTRLPYEGLRPPEAIAEPIILDVLDTEFLDGRLLHRLVRA